MCVCVCVCVCVRACVRECVEPWRCGYGSCHIFIVVLVLVCTYKPGIVELFMSHFHRGWLVL